ncbi:MAG: hypothetical protein J6A01_03570, partial [Proteobacteria bacterium]|nr:hypothetical protein [Pseudomonadota bacterium]
EPSGCKVNGEDDMLKSGQCFDAVIPKGSSTGNKNTKACYISKNLIASCAFGCTTDRTKCADTNVDIGGESSLSQLQDGDKYPSECKESTLNMSLYTKTLSDGSIGVLSRVLKTIGQAVYMLCRGDSNCSGLRLLPQSAITVDSDNRVVIKSCIYEENNFKCQAGFSSIINDILVSLCADVYDIDSYKRQSYSLSAEGDGDSNVIVGTPCLFNRCNDTWEACGGFSCSLKDEPDKTCELYEGFKGKVFCNGVYCESLYSLKGEVGVSCQSELPGCYYEIHFDKKKFYIVFDKNKDTIYPHKPGDGFDACN